MSVSWIYVSCPHSVPILTAFFPFPPRPPIYTLFPYTRSSDLGLCVPERYGGLGADYETYCLVAEQLAQGNASTSLTFNIDRKSTRLNSSLANISYAVFCLIKKKTDRIPTTANTSVIFSVIAPH